MNYDHQSTSSTVQTASKKDPRNQGKHTAAKKSPQTNKVNPGHMVPGWSGSVAGGGGGQGNSIFWQGAALTSNPKNTNKFWHTPKIPANFIIPQKISGLQRNKQCQQC